METMSDIAVSASGVWKNFRLYHEHNRFIKAAILRGRRARFEEFWALQDVSFDVRHGSTFGIIGSNGSGKSTMLKCLAGILYPDRGRVSVQGRLAALLELGAGFHPELSGRENVYLNGAILGMGKKELSKKFDSIVDFAGLEKFIDSPVKNYSSGMMVRLGFSVASHVEPEILLIDEVLSVGDQAFQRKSIEKIEEFRREGRTIVFVSHGLSQVAQLCKEVVWLEFGQLRRIGDVNEVIAEYTGESYGSQTDTATSLGRRWGTGKASITSVEVLNSVEKRVEKIETGEGLTFRVNFDSHAVIEDLVVFIKISTLNGLDVWSTSTRTNGVALPRVIGSGAVSLTIPSLPLLEGTYLVSIALRNGRETVEFDHWEHAHKFDVHQFNLFDQGIVNIASRWQTI
jgi:ABC-2 type transport system ATP-binding protein